MKVSLHGEGSSESVVEAPAIPSRRCPPLTGAWAAACSHIAVAAVTVIPIAAARVMKSRRVTPDDRAVRSVFSSLILLPLALAALPIAALAGNAGPPVSRIVAPGQDVRQPIGAQLRHRPQQHLGFGMQRRGEDLRDRALG